MANLINLRKFSNYKTISLAPLIFLTTISFMDTYFYFSNQLAESKTAKESLKQSITEKRIFAISPNNTLQHSFLLLPSFPLLHSFSLPRSISLLCSTTRFCSIRLLCSLLCLSLDSTCCFSVVSDNKVITTFL